MSRVAYRSTNLRCLLFCIKVKNFYLFTCCSCFASKEEEEVGFQGEVQIACKFFNSENSGALECFNVKSRNFFVAVKKTVKIINRILQHMILLLLFLCFSVFAQYLYISKQSSSSSQTICFPIIVLSCSGSPFICLLFVLGGGWFILALTFCCFIFCVLKT